MATLATTLGGILSLCIIFLLLTTGTGVLRFWARYKQKTGFQLDDWMVVAAWTFFAGLNALIFYGIHIDYIGHRQPLDQTVVDEKHPTVVRIYLALDCLGIITLGLTKLSALLFYRRIFCSHVHNIFNRISLFLITVVILWIFIFFVLALNFCIGHNIQFNFGVGHTAQCRLIYPWFEASTTSNFVLDVLILGLPLPKIWALNIPRPKKFAVMGVFLLALVGLAASITRMAFTIYKIRRGRPINNVDGYQSNTQMAYFLLLECGMTILAVNLPSLWYFLAGGAPNRLVSNVRSLITLDSLLSARSLSRRNSARESRIRSWPSSANRESFPKRSLESDWTGDLEGSSSRFEMFDGLGLKKEVGDVRVERKGSRVSEQV